MRCDVALAVLLLASISGRMALAEVIYGPIVNPTNGNEYYLLDKSIWIDSELEAMALGGHLATINDMEENAWLFDTFAAVAMAEAMRVGDADKVCLWIGFTDYENEGIYSWISGDPTIYTNWSGREPGNNADDEDFAAMLVNYFGQPGTWHDVVGNFRFGDDTYGVVEVVAPEVVPEPSTWALAVVGLVFVLILTVRRTSSIAT